MNIYIIYIKIHILNIDTNTFHWFSPVLICHFLLAKKNPSQLCHSKDEASVSTEVAFNVRKLAKTFQLPRKEHPSGLTW